MEKIKKINIDSINNNNSNNFKFNNDRDIEMETIDLVSNNNNSKVQEVKSSSSLKSMDPENIALIKENNALNVNYFDGKLSKRRKVEYSEEDIEIMARIVQREADIDSGKAGTIAVAEEIRNRVLTDIDPTYMPDTLHGVLFADNQYILKNAKDPLAGTSEAREDVKQLCRDVLDGKIWVFGQDNVLSHASHSGKELHESQIGVPNSKNAGAFYYDNIDRTQTFYSIGEPRETTSSVYLARDKVKIDKINGT